MSAYRSGGRTRNGAAKQVLNVGSGSVTPRSVPATLAVYPERKKKRICSASRRDTGGSTPNASADRKSTLAGCPPCPERSALGIASSGEAERVFSGLLS